MRSFVPSANNPPHSEDVYRTIRDRVAAASGGVSERRLFRRKFHQDGSPRTIALRSDRHPLGEGAVQLESSLLATVTGECVVIWDAVRQSHIVIALSQVSGLKRIRTTHPALLVIATGLFLISAAAFYSKQGNGAGVPAALLGTACATGYLLSRGVSVAFIVGSTSLETPIGSLSQASALIAAVQSAKTLLEQDQGSRC